jgi:hypothetical protein
VDRDPGAFDLRLVHPGDERFRPIDRLGGKRVTVDGERAGIVAPRDAVDACRAILQHWREMGMDVERDALRDRRAHDAAERRGVVASTGSLCTKPGFAAVTVSPLPKTSR